MKKSESTYELETSRPMARVLSRLEDVKRFSEGYYHAVCPCGECEGAKLIAIEGWDGRAMIATAEACRLCYIVPALGLTAGDLFERIDHIDLFSVGPAFPRANGLEPIFKKS